LSTGLDIATLFTLHGLLGLQAGLDAQQLQQQLFKVHKWTQVSLRQQAQPRLDD
jgi:hypothetical protein